MNLIKNNNSKKLENSNSTEKHQPYTKITTSYIKPYNQMTYREKVGYSLILQARETEQCQDK